MFDAKNLSTAEHTSGVRVMPKPLSMSVGLPPGFNGCRLNVRYPSEFNSLRISKRVAEALIASGMPHEG